MTSPTSSRCCAPEVAARVLGNRRRPDRRGPRTHRRRPGDRAFLGDDQGRAPVDVDHRPGVVGFQGHRWYRGEISATPAGAGLPGVQDRRAGRLSDPAGHPLLPRISQNRGRGRLRAGAPDGAGARLTVQNGPPSGPWRTTGPTGGRPTRRPVALDRRPLHRNSPASHRAVARTRNPDGAMTQYAEPSPKHRTRAPYGASATARLRRPSPPHRIRTPFRGSTTAHPQRNATRSPAHPLTRSRPRLRSCELLPSCRPQPHKIWESAPAKAGNCSPRALKRPGDRERAALRGRGPGAGAKGGARERKPAGYGPLPACPVDRGPPGPR